MKHTRLITQTAQGVAGCFLGLAGQAKGIPGRCQTLLLDVFGAGLDGLDILFSFFARRDVARLGRAIEESARALLGVVARKELVAITVDISLAAGIDVADAVVSVVLVSHGGVARVPGGVRTGGRGIGAAAVGVAVAAGDVGGSV
jgi:hypothetical protein